ncbi:hypothetical protein MYAM1_001405 [Malassezia yamatoensis]|uniref:Uncharacterized protein n=1 Tax=Malassezia yamatoensis TaxID=253288 RepID=A0AAJ5YQD9_9BASI|nr:hypothetical protein MYAM1_001405 [Malassezia yamatoensis]
MIALRYLTLVFVFVALVNCGVLYRPAERRGVSENAQKLNRLERRQDASASSSMATGTASSMMSSASSMPTSAMAAGSSSAAAATTSSSSMSVPAFSYGTANSTYPGVVATGPLGATNPSQPSLNTTVNQTSVSRLVSINSVDDWCTFGPINTSSLLGEQEGEVVAYCTKPRNDARVIPDGTVTAAHFVKTPLYVQVMALGDFTKIGFGANDTGGELDPHGATNMGNPVGGNVTSNVTGSDVFYEEWMNYVGYNIMCFRVCIAGTDKAEPKTECQHTLDEMGCWTVMPGNYTDNIFESCDADAAYPPGIYVSDGSTSSFEQYATGLWTSSGSVLTYTNGESTETTPTTANSMPSSSNCQIMTTIANGIASIIPAPSSSAAPAASPAAAAPASDASPAPPAPASDASPAAPAPASDASPAAPAPASDASPAAPAPASDAAPAASSAAA